MITHCGLEWEDPSYNLGAYGSSGVPLTSECPPKRTFEVSPESLRAYAPVMMEQFGLDPDSPLSLYHMSESYIAENWVPGSEPEKLAFEYTQPQLNIALDMKPTPQGRLREQMILKDIEGDFCEVTRLRRTYLHGSSKSIHEGSPFSGNGAQIISQAEMVALGNLTDMLYMNGPDAVRYTPANE